MLDNFINKESGVESFFIVNRSEKSSQVGIPPSILDTCDLFSAADKRFKGIFKDDIRSILLESEKGIVMIEHFRDSILIVRCAVNAKIGRIRMVLRETLYT